MLANRVDARGRREGLAPRYWLLIHTNSFPYIKPRTRVSVFLFGFLTLADRTDRLSRNVGKDLPLLAA